MIRRLSTAALTVHSRTVTGCRRPAGAVTLPRMNQLLRRGTTLAACLMLLLPLPSPSGVLAPPPAAVAFQPVEPAYRWPLAGPPPVTRRFDPPAQPWLPGHRGVDLAGPPGAVVRAAGPGTVYFAGPVAGRGVVSVAHPDRLRTTYEPVTPVVSAGEVVAAGDPIGVLDTGHAGCPVAACLHWGLRRGDSYLDPLALLGLGPVRLLPRDLP